MAYAIASGSHPPCHVGSMANSTRVAAGLDATPNKTAKAMRCSIAIACPVERTKRCAPRSVYKCALWEERTHQHTHIPHLTSHSPPPLLLLDYYHSDRTSKSTTTMGTHKRRPPGAHPYDRQASQTIAISPETTLTYVAPRPQSHREQTTHPPPRAHSSSYLRARHTYLGARACTATPVSGTAGGLRSGLSCGARRQGSRT